MNKLVYLILIISFSCKAQSDINLYSKIVGNVTVFDSASVFINEVMVARLKVERVVGDTLFAKISLHSSIPSNSVLYYHNNPVGEAFFEIIKGNSDRDYMNGDEMPFAFAPTQKANGDSTTQKLKPDLKKLKSPVVKSQ